MAKSRSEKLVYLADWYQKNKVHQAGYYAKYRERIRMQMVAAYGGRCVWCGQGDPIVLVLDHINDDAQSDRAANKHKGGYKMYMKLKKDGWPQKSHQLLCHNCNFKKEYVRRKRAVEIRQAA